MISCLLIESKNQMSPLTLVPNSRCKIRLDNLEFRRIFRNFSIFLGSPSFFDGLEVFSWGSLRRLFFYLCFDMIVMYFLHFEVLRMKKLCFAQRFALQSVLKLFFPLTNLTTYFEDATKLFIVIYLFFKKEIGRLFV